MEQLRTIGYYIAEVIDTPEWLHEVGSRILSVSPCIGEIHPKEQTYFFGGWRKGEEREYQSKLKMDDGRYKAFSEDAKRLFSTGLLAVDGRFSHLSDARRFYNSYFRGVTCKLVSISACGKYFEILAQELGHSNAPVSGTVDDSLPLGCDILGWDIGGFHSFLCNSLHRDLPAARFNSFGLLENAFEEVVQFASQIEGCGEPVEWIPCKVGQCVP